MCHVTHLSTKTNVSKCSVLQCVAVCCSVLQCVAVSCDSTFHADQRKKVRVPKQKEDLGVLQCVAVCCSTANPTWGDIFESSKLKARTSLLPRFGEKGRSNFELFLCSSVQGCHSRWDGLYMYVHICMCMRMGMYIYIYTYMQVRIFVYM